MANPAVIVDFLADTKQLTAGLRQVESSSSKLGGKFKSMAKAGALAAGAAGVGALTATLKIGIDEFAEASKVAAQTDSVLKSTGKAAGVTADHVSTLAGALMKKSGVDDEAIQSGENLLLTFTNIRNEAGKGNDVFDQTTKAALDMSVALGTDMKSSAMTLGKALNDPIKGMSKLTKQGVTFTDAQKKQAEEMVKAGNAAGAQKIILAELNKEFGGSAEAAGKTLPGQINILKESFSNFAGMLVAQVVPALQAAIAWLRDHWGEISAAFNSFWATTQPILANLLELLKAVAGVIATAWPAVAPIVEGLGKVIQSVGAVIANALKLIVDLIHGDWTAAWNDLKKIVASALDAIRIYLVTAPLQIAKLALALGQAILNGVKAGVSDLVAWVRDRVGDVVNAVLLAAAGAYAAAKALGGRILSGVRDGITGLYTEVRERISGAIDAIGSLVETAAAKARQVGTAIKNGVVEGVTGLASIVRDLIDKAVSAVKDALRNFKLPGIKIKGHKITGDIYPFRAIGLAKGGIVTRPTFAMIGEAGPEAVVPLSGGGGAGPIQVRVFIGDQELTGIVRSEVVSANTSLARSLLAGSAA